MGLQQVAWCGAGVWFALVLGLKEVTPNSTPNFAPPIRDCELYNVSGGAPPLLVFQQRVTVGVVHLEGSLLSATLKLHSSSTDSSCTLYFIQGSVTYICDSDARHHHAWPAEIFKRGETTELWLEASRQQEEASRPAWEVRVVGRRGGLRGHLLLPDSGLQPPIRLWWEDAGQPMQYFSNCVTGCLFRKSARTLQGGFSVFLRHDEDVVNVTLNCGKRLSTNVTLDDLGPPGVKNLTAVWSIELSNVGVLVDGVPAGTFTQHEHLDSKRHVEAVVEGGSGGLVAACDPRFREVASGGGAEEEATTPPARQRTPSTSPAPPSTSSLPEASGSDAAFTTSVYGEGSSCRHPGLLIVLSIVSVVCIMTTVGLVLMACLYHHAATKLHQVTLNDSDAPAAFLRSSSIRSSTRSVRSTRGSQRRNKKQTDASTPTQNEDYETPSETTLTTSGTVTTPLTTPVSRDDPRAPKVLSTNDFVDLELM